MTQTRDIERLLDAWLADGPTQVPDRVFDDAVARLRREPQRRVWQLPWRDHNVTISIRLAAAVLVLLAGAVIAVGFGSRTTPTNPTPTTTPSPTATSVAAATPTAEPVQCLEDGPPRELCLGRLEPGSYTLGSPLVPFDVTVPAGWSNPMNILGGAMLERDADVGDAAIYVWPDPVVASQAACMRALEPGLGRRVSDLVAFLTSKDGLQVTARTATTLGGLRGETMQLVREDGPPVPPCESAVSLFVHAGTITDGFWWDLGPGQVMKIWLLEATDGHTVLVNVQASSAEFAAFLRQAEPIVESIDFTP